MSTHEDLWFSRITSPQKAADIRLTKEDGTEVWIDVKGSQLPSDTRVRLSQAIDGRIIITAMTLGLDTNEEIDWATMRAIKPASIVAGIFAGFDPRNPTSQVEHWQNEQKNNLARPTEHHDEHGNFVGFDPDGDEPGSPGEQDYHEALSGSLRAAAIAELWNELQQAGPASKPPKPATRPRSSVAADLNEFAAVYNRLYAANPRRATAAAAEAMNISRATAIRRVKECRDLGLINTREKPR